MPQVVAAVLLFTLASASLANAQQADCAIEVEVILNTPAPPQTPLSVSQYLQAKIPTDTSILVLGDSIASTLGDALGATSKEVVSNLAGSGDSIQNASWRLVYHAEALATINPSSILIELGTNNMFFPACAIKASFGKYLSDVQELWPSARIVVLEILPRGSNFKQNDTTRKSVNQWLAEESQARKFSFVDFDDDVLTCGLNTREVDPALSACSPNLSCNNFTGDNVHLSPDGLNFVLSAVLPSLQL